MNSNDQIHPQKKGLSTTMRGVACVGVAIFLSIVAMGYGYFADGISSTVSHSSLWIMLPLLMICGVFYALYWFMEMVIYLGGAYDLFMWGRDVLKKVRQNLFAS